MGNRGFVFVSKVCLSVLSTLLNERLLAKGNAVRGFDTWPWICGVLICMSKESFSRGTLGNVSRKLFFKLWFSPWRLTVSKFSASPALASRSAGSFPVVRSACALEASTSFSIIAETGKALLQQQTLTVSWEVSKCKRPNKDKWQKCEYGVLFLSLLSSSTIYIHCDKKVAKNI